MIISHFSEEKISYMNINQIQSIVYKHYTLTNKIFIFNLILIFINKLDKQLSFSKIM